MGYRRPGQRRGAATEVRLSLDRGPRSRESQGAAVCVRLSGLVLTVSEHPYPSARSKSSKFRSQFVQLLITIEAEARMFVNKLGYEGADPWLFDTFDRFFSQQTPVARAFSVHHFFMSLSEDCKSFCSIQQTHFLADPSGHTVHQHSAEPPKKVTLDISL